jgi:hypothetical protein
MQGLTGWLADHSTSKRECQIPHHPSSRKHGRRDRAPISSSASRTRGGTEAQPAKDPSREGNPAHREGGVARGSSKILVGMGEFKRGGPLRGRTLSALKSSSSLARWGLTGGRGSRPRTQHLRLVRSNSRSALLPLGSPLLLWLTAVIVAGGCARVHWANGMMGGCRPCVRACVRLCHRAVDVSVARDGASSPAPGGFFPSIAPASGPPVSRTK